MFRKKKMNIILHIGNNKTGSSSLQYLLRENRALLKKHGILYPEIGIGYSAHHGIAFDIQREAGSPRKSGDRWGELDPNWLNQLEEEAKDYKWVILSSEAFQAQGNPRKVAKVFSGHNVKIVVYLREHFSYLRSWYQQAIQSQNISCSLREFSAIVNANQSNIVDEWSKAFGKQNIIPRIFHKNALFNGDITSDFFHCTELPDIDVSMLNSGETLMNQSVSGNLLFFKKMINLVISKEEAQEIADEIGAMTVLGEQFQGSIEVDETTAKNIRHLYSEDRLKLKKNYNLDFDQLSWSHSGKPFPDIESMSEDWKIFINEIYRTDKQLLKYIKRIPPLNINAEQLQKQ